ncbi:hypothetical protein [Paraburkholderia sp. C35]|uniref:hypothetical protein n=1 Tax=Paraburkholderia sp. C35 TaxID=2126993 RepID=UPI000D68BB93|nr:hypothetical protein [Paraburkholderia sp. C35]
MRRLIRAAIALSIASSTVAHASAMLQVNAYEDRIEARRLEAHREADHREDERREQERLAEARRETRMDAYNAWLARWHEMHSRDGITP